MNASQNYYEVLGVDTRATSSAIKVAFKQLALKYHPDVYKGDDAQERMRLLLLAYKTLSDPDERKTYDQRLGLDGARVLNGNLRKRKVVSPAARRDRHRYYAFPIVQAGQSVTLDLGTMTYALAPQDWQILEQHGMLRGVAPEMQQHTYFCHRCQYRWQVTSERGNVESWDVIRNCPSCRSWDWSEYLLLRCIHCEAVFESEQIRYEVGQISYGDSKNPDLCPPYELFPLCPYCGVAHWCPSDEERVSELRRQQVQQQRLIRYAWIGLVIAMLLIACVVVVGTFR
ncbi:MAG TPA: DnaJ domain-containing protein [Ktedonobacteraceae bacterium]|jgi:hypothetical protein|nr:DnaJ domain-containing protein [Ktedonobacteraceae bacterium]